MTTQTLLVLGASGDLSARLLLPGLGRLLASDPERRVQLIGAGIEEIGDDDWQALVRGAFGDAGGEAVEHTLASTRYVSADVTAVDDLKQLLELCEAPPSIYFALPPAITAKACGELEQTSLPEGTTLALEKPFGTDRASAASLNRQLLHLVPEDRIHRVDHFLGRATVLNLFGLRFANRVVEPLLSNQHVESIEIVYDEHLALENRARYYDGAGALVDMIQSHLLQVMAVLMMEAPATLEPADVRGQKHLTLRATRLWQGDPAIASSRRARYTAGSIDGRDLPAYADEPGVDPSRETETLAELVVEVQNWRWSGVPVTLRSGKALAGGRREIVVTFKEPPSLPDGLHGAVRRDRLRLGLKPDEMTLELNINGPGDPFVLDANDLRAEFNPGRLDAYGEVLSGILDSDPTLSVRGDTAEECWRVVEPALAAWRSGEVPLEEYPAGSDGPEGWRGGRA